ncbi:MAG: glycosyltransferase [Rhodospirillales bacterium]|nr:glycosyltransferase [Rhodospirillales bacterium]
MRLVDFSVTAISAVAAAAVWAIVGWPVDGDRWSGVVNGLSFSPYRIGQSPIDGTEPSPEEIAEDVRFLADKTSSLRLYTSLGNVAHVPEIAERYGLRVTAAAWIGPDMARNESEVTAVLQQARQHSSIDRIIVGNEALLRTDVKVSQLIEYIRRVKKDSPVPVSTAEPWHVWLDHPELASEVDFIGVHILPYWEGVPAEDAVDYMLTKLRDLNFVFPEKKIVLTEVGWPSQGRMRKGADPSPVNQTLFLRKFLATAERHRLDYFVIEAFDQPWKREIEGGIGAYWGMYDAERNAKVAFEGPVANHPHWPYLAFGSLLIAVIGGIIVLRKEDGLATEGRLFLAGLLQVITGIAVWTWNAYAVEYATPLSTVVGLLLIPAFALLILVAITEGIEAAECHWIKAWRRHFVAIPGAALPRVSVHVPICNEPPAMVIDTMKALANLDYPDFEVLIIDNNTADESVWRPVEAFAATLGPRFKFFHIDKLAGFKAGALNFAMRHIDPEAPVIAVIDSDYMVERDWLKTLVPAFADEKVAIVQAPQDYRDGSETPFKSMCFWEYAGFFHLGMVQRNERNAIIQHGTMSLIRHSALKAVGGWSEWCITEDAELGLKLFEAGHEAIYVPQSFGRGVTPDSFAAYKKQRFRWAYGAIQILKRHRRDLFTFGPGRLTAGQRFHFIAGWMPWLADALHLFFTVGVLVWTTGYLLFPRHFDLPLTAFVAATIAFFAFKAVKSVWLYVVRVPCSLTAGLGAMLAGLALSHTVAKAVWHGLFTSSRPFLRTPKCENQPALIRGLSAAWEELALLGVLWLGAGVVAWKHGEYEPEALLFVALLLLQSTPYVAAIGVSMVNTFAPWRLTETVPQPQTQSPVAQTAS